MFKRNLKHKFGAIRTKRGEIKFASRLEAHYYDQLLLRQKAGHVLFFLRQVPFSLPGNITYRLDFLEFHAPKNDQPGDIIFTETKGFMTADAKIKIAQVEDIYNIHINVVTSV